MFNPSRTTGGEPASSGAIAGFMSYVALAPPRGMGAFVAVNR
jgi:hypothetical protein